MLTTLLDASVARLVEIALREDLHTGDITSEATIPADTYGTAQFRFKQDGVVCGLPIAKLVFQTLDGTITWTEFAAEGDDVQAGTVVAEVEGPVRTLLSGERTALNFMQRMSGVATLTRRYVKAVEGTRATVLDTRKTIPGWRLLDKYAVRTGGASNHRFGLFDMVMIKDNHIDASGGITEAVAATREFLGGRSVPVEVETRSTDEIREALACEGVRRIMFDNFTPGRMREAVQLVDRRVETEASGGITLENIRDYAETGVDFISIGALTHSAVALDISMKIASTSRAGLAED